MVRRMALLMAVLVALGACSLAPIDLQGEKPLALRTTITAWDGSLLARLFKENRALASPDEIPDVLRYAVLAAEDSRFFEHNGYDLRSIARAALVNLDEGEVVQGGSTITQQYVKNTFFRHPGRTFRRKARELRLAIEVERRYTKDEILARYLNTVYLGNGAYGVKVAAKNYFRKDLRELTAHEAALLAAVIKAPSYYDPRERPRKARQRRNYVLRRMVDLGWMTPRAARKERRAELGVVETPPRVKTRQPYFVEAVMREIKDDRRFGATEKERADALYKGGLRVTTTLRPRLQAAAEDAVATVLNQPGDPEAAVVAIKPSTGEVVAMVGGRDWTKSQVNLALGVQGGGSGRQPGSSFKPIVAAAAMEEGISLGAHYSAGPASFLLPDGSTWNVRNSEGTAGGTLPLNEAMVRSVNGVYARLTLDVSAARVAQQARYMGVRSKLPVYPSIGLGGMEVSALDMASAYATLANNGTAIEPTTIDEIVLANGEVMHPKQRLVPQAVSPGNAFLLTKVLEQVVIRGTGKAAAIGRPVAGKTGTTNNYTDAWFVGYTPDLAVAVWVGYPQGLIPMLSVHGIRVFGGTFPALIFKEFMTAALANKPVSRFKVPKSDLVRVLIDPVTGLLAAPWCPGDLKTMLRQLAPKEYCPPPPPAPIFTPTPPGTATPSPSPSSTGGKGDPSPSPTGKDKGKPSPEPEPSPEPTETKGDDE